MQPPARGAAPASVRAPAILASAATVERDRDGGIRREGANAIAGSRTQLRYRVAAPIANATQAPNKVQASIATALSGLRQRCQGSSKVGRQDMARLRSSDVGMANTAQSSQHPSQQARTRSHNRGLGGAAPTFVYETGHAAAVMVTALSCAGQAHAASHHAPAAALPPRGSDQGRSRGGNAAPPDAVCGAVPGGPRRAAAGKTRSVLQRARVEGDVLADEAADEVVAVVVAGLHAQGQRIPGGIGGGL